MYKHTRLSVKQLLTEHFVGFSYVLVGIQGPYQGEAKEAHTPTATFERMQNLGYNF